MSGCDLLRSTVGRIDGETADPGACMVRIPEEETVAERVAALRAIGLFADRADLTDEALAASVQQGIDEWWGDLGGAGWFQELAVAEQDRSRVWWQDLEWDVSEENEVYVQMLEDWASISVGAFQPSEVEESWASWTGPVTVTFTLDGEPQTLRPAYLEDWIDLEVILAVNDLIATSGRQFSVFQAFDQTAYVMALTPSERSALEDRGWCFI